jgi:hypothetical protein
MPSLEGYCELMSKGEVGKFYPGWKAPIIGGNVFSL